jgi:hypothetical protein
MADSTVERIVAGVKFHPEFDIEVLRYDSSLGFIALQGGRHRDDSTLIGFGAPFSPIAPDGFDAGDEVRPITQLQQIPKDFRTNDLLKGVGFRAYNTPEAALGYTDIPDTWIGAYAFEVDRRWIYDMRQEEGSRPARIMRHGFRMVQRYVNIRGLESVTDRIHEKYGEADAVLMTQPPRADARQRVERDAPNPEGVPAEFMIIRNAGITLRRVGTFPLKDRKPIK